MAGFAPAFRALLIALARAHDLLTRENWAGATLGDVARAALAPWLGDGSRVSLSGPPVRLAPRQALALSMALQELATNAAKHGALTLPGGSVVVAWRREGAAVALDWAGRDGPSVRPPTCRGFGSRLLGRPLAADLGGAVELRFESGGLRCAMRFPAPGAAPALPRAMTNS